MEPNFITIKDLSFSYPTYQVFNHFSLNLLPKNTTIMDNTSSGKTTLLKLLTGNLKPTSGTITFMDSTISPVFVFDYLLFDKDTVMEEFSFFLRQTKMNPKKIEDEIYTFASYFDIKKLLKKKMALLSKEDQYLIKILSYLIMCPSIVFFDDVLGHLSKKRKKQIYSFMKEKNILFVQVTSNMEDVMYADYLIMLHEGQVAIEGETLSVLQEEKLLRRLGYTLPFQVDLCTQLKYYDLLKKNYVPLEEMEELLWK